MFACEPEWGALAKELGGEDVKVYVATTAMQDPHHIEARPSLIAKMRQADSGDMHGRGVGNWLAAGAAVRVRQQQVMVSELTSNSGEPIRKIFDKIATFIHSRLLSQLPPADIVWVEHYQDAGYIPFLKGSHVFFEVLFRYKRNGRLHEYSLPKCRAMNNEQLRALAGDIGRQSGL